MSGRVGVEQTPDIETVLAEQLCPRGHGDGWFSMTTDAEGTTTSKGEHHWPCGQHRAQARNLTAALAPVLAVAVREARAAELREAADAAETDDLPHGDGDWLDGACDTILWLRDRADRIAVDAPEGGAYLCRICGQMVTSGSDRAHDGASHDARTADLPTPKGGA